MPKNHKAYVIPLFNGYSFIELLKEIIGKHKSLQEAKFILVEDSVKSRQDKSERVPQEIAPNVLLAFTKSNLGQHAATAFGLNFVEEEDIVVTIDQDAIPFLPEIHAFCQRLHPKEKELIYLCPKTRKRSWYRNFGSKFTLAIINTFSAYKLKGIFSIRILRQSKDVFSKIHPYFIFDLSLLRQGYKAKYIETNFHISDKKGTYNIIKLSKVFFNISLFYTYLFESIVILGILTQGVIVIIPIALLTLLLLYKYYWLRNGV